MRVNAQNSDFMNVTEPHPVFLLLVQPFPWHPGDPGAFTFSLLVSGGGGETPQVPTTNLGVPLLFSGCLTPSFLCVSGELLGKGAYIDMAFYLFPFPL